MSLGEKRLDLMLSEAHCPWKGSKTRVPKVLLEAESSGWPDGRDSGWVLPLPECSPSCATGQNQVLWMQKHRQGCILTGLSEQGNQAELCLCTFSVLDLAPSERQLPRWPLAKLIMEVPGLGSKAAALRAHWSNFRMRRTCAVEPLAPSAPLVDLHPIWWKFRAKIFTPHSPLHP